MLVVNWIQQSLMELFFFIYRFHTLTSSKKFFEVTEQTEFLIRSTLSRVYCQKQSAVPSLQPLNVIDPVANQFCRAVMNISLRFLYDMIIYLKSV